MLLTTTNELLRAVVALALRADGGLVEGAARNAAVVVAERGTRRLDDARTMRDLARIGFADDAASPAPELPGAASRPSARR
jgi:hypothetical protein